MKAAIDTLQALLFELAGILPSDPSSLLGIMKQVKLDANQTYINEGEKERKLAFIERGIIRAFTTKENGDEATLFIRWEGHFIASHDTIIHKQPSRFIYQALEPTTLMEMDYDVLEELLKIHTGYEPARNFILMHMLSETLKSMESFVLYTPQERYENLLSERFDLVNRVPDKHLASMLGITPVSLSRIRKRMFGKK